MPHKEIVTVDVSKTLAPPWTVRLAIFLDKSPEEIEDFLDRQPEGAGAIAMPFYTGTVEALPDFSQARLNDWIMIPVYVGNLHPVGKAIRQLVDREVADLRILGAEVEIILDEAKDLPGY